MGLSGGEFRCASSRRDFVNVLSANALAQASRSAELGVKPWKDTIFLWRSVLGKEWIFFEKWSCLLQGLNLVSRETAAGHMPCQCRSLQGGMNAIRAGRLRELSQLSWLLTHQLRSRNGLLSWRDVSEEFNVCFLNSVCLLFFLALKFYSLSLFCSNFITISLGVFPLCWSCLNSSDLLELAGHSLQQIWKDFSHYLFNYFSTPFSFPVSSF